MTPARRHVEGGQGLTRHKTSQTRVAQAKRLSHGQREHAARVPGAGAYG
jgi:hypothetical protein